MNYITKILSNSIFKRFFLITFLLSLYVFISAISYTNAVCSDLSKSVFRLHVIANSDSEEDQKLKLIVRDNVIQYINEISQNASTKDEVMQIAKNNLNQIKNIATETIKKMGFNYTVTVRIGNFPFPSKKYGDITFPPGYYDALKIEIGNANGQNWWCVMFPPLCFVDVTSGVVPDSSKKIMKTNLTEEEYNLISETTSDIKVKFKIVEVLQNLTISGIFM